MSNPGAKFFRQIHVVADLWVAEDADISVDDVADKVQVAMMNACDAVAKEIECPDVGIEVCVR